MESNILNYFQCVGISHWHFHSGKIVDKIVMAFSKLRSEAGSTPSEGLPLMGYPWIAPLMTTELYKMEYKINLNVFIL